MNKIKIGVEYDVNSAWLTKLKMTSKDRFTVTTKYIPAGSFTDDCGEVHSTPARPVTYMFFKGNIKDAERTILYGIHYLYIIKNKKIWEKKKEGPHDN